jgi:acyl dehydratase
VLSLLPKFCNETFSLLDVELGINYGLDKVRFMSPTLVDSSIRARVSLLECSSMKQGAKYKLKVVFELEGQTKPACVAEFIGLAYLKSQSNKNAL